MIETGKTLQNRYRIDKQIGQGGMGAVYVATDERFNSMVAIKETLCMDDNFRKAIEREARLLNSLKHAALPRVSDHFEENDSQFLVMEFIPGDDLSCILETKGEPFEVVQVLKWADQLLDALDFLHNQEIPVVHRDIKPQNLKVTPQGQVILLDFGLAKGNPTDAGHQTAAKSIFGYSRNYASLEQIQGTGTDPRSDIYSLAATLYHLLTGIAPEDALTRAMAVLSQKPDPLVPASAVRPEIPAGVAGVLQKALDLNAGERPHTAREMRQMLSNSENYAYLASAATNTADVTELHVFAQPTRLMPGQTHAANAPNADIKTEVMAADLSQVTSVRGLSSAVSPAQGVTSSASGNATAAPKNSRGVVVSAVAVAFLAVIGLAGGGAYLYDPTIFGSGSDARPGTTNTKTSSERNAIDPDSSRSTIGNTAIDGNVQAQSSANSAPSTSEKERSADVAGKQPNTPKTAKSATEGDPNAGDSTIDIQSPPDEDLPENMVITRKNPDGTTTTMRINKPGQPPPTGIRPEPKTDGPMINGIDMSKLTPAQRRKLRDAMRRANGVPPGIRPPSPPKY
ncbi:MAG: protein kinase [Pyrinomonadaceae bacterium]|nr:protein kinase [Pyrinomonadaceae bacterium]